MHTKNKYLTSLVVAGLLFPQSAIGEFPAESFQQDFMITAYYSPLPDQCCYVKGSFEEDVILNGRGTHGADGTPVYPGMIAAPPTYAFGTRVDLPGIGIVTVHDRGGAIQELTKVHRLDVWVGHGEEGLARALAFGVKRVRGTIYPVGGAQPGEEIAFKAFPAPLKILQPYIADHTTFLDLHAKAGDVSMSVQMLQEQLRDAGYLAEKPNGVFGPATQESLKNLYADFGVTDSPDTLTENGAAVIVAIKLRDDAEDPIANVVEQGSSPAHVAEAKRLLRFLGHYRGRTNGTFDEPLRQAIMKVQKEANLIADQTSLGAGRIGPKTRTYLLTAWKRKLTVKRAEQILAMHRVRQIVAKRGSINAFLEKGDKGDDVRALQKELARAGFLAAADVTGLFGDRTLQGVVRFQIAQRIIQKSTDQGAGYVGPATLTTLKRMAVDQLYKIVRAQGWGAI